MEFHAADEGWPFVIAQWGWKTLDPYLAYDTSMAEKLWDFIFKQKWIEVKV